MCINVHKNLKEAKTTGAPASFRFFMNGINRFIVGIIRYLRSKIYNISNEIRRDFSEFRRGDDRIPQLS